MKKPKTRNFKITLLAIAISISLTAYGADPAPNGEPGAPGANSATVGIGGVGG